MTCQYCQTWVGDDEHRCPRCGRRVRAVPGRISSNTFPIAATATAIAYDFPPAPLPARSPEQLPQHDLKHDLKAGQQPLFQETFAAPRVLQFASHTSSAELEAIHARAPKAPARANRPARPRDDQAWLDLIPQEVAAPKTASFCRLEVAPFAERFHAAAVDCGVVAAACTVLLALYFVCGGQIVWDRHLLPFSLLALTTVPLFYKILWSSAGKDTLGMQTAGLHLVDLDGQRPSVGRRYQRMAGTIISVAAAGIGIIWGFVDEEHLTWHDHISGTFPTRVS